MHGRVFQTTKRVLHNRTRRVCLPQRCAPHHPQLASPSPLTCVWPAGDWEVRLAMENMAVVDPKDKCMEDLQYFLCKMYFPQCLFGQVRARLVSPSTRRVSCSSLFRLQTLPLCWKRCIAAYESCGIACEPLYPCTHAVAVPPDLHSVVVACSGFRGGDLPDVCRPWHGRNGRARVFKRCDRATAPALAAGPNPDRCGYGVGRGSGGVDGGCRETIVVPALLHSNLSHRVPTFAQRGVLGAVFDEATPARATCCLARAIGLYDRSLAPSRGTAFELTSRHDNCAALTMIEGRASGAMTDCTE